MFTNLALRALILELREIGYSVRTYADDIQAEAEGAGHSARVVRASGVMESYLAGLGSRVSPSKCLWFSTCKATRARLRR
eukprot:2529953-Alexandrium_andersonii.AAC.1